MTDPLDLLRMTASGNGTVGTMGGVMGTGGSTPSPVVTPGATIFGMPIANFTAILGMLGQAVSPKDSPASRIGGVAASMGQAKLHAQAAELQDLKNKEFTLKLLQSINKPSPYSSITGNPDMVGGTSEDDLSNTPEGFYKSTGFNLSSKL